jgi:ABC-type nitrate/sulfonate/bicarbonate transport system permease component
MTALRRVRGWTPALLVAVGFILLWQASIQVFGIQRFILPAPFAIGAAFSTYFSEIWSAASYTAGEAASGGLVHGSVEEEARRVRAEGIA